MGRRKDLTGMRFGRLVVVELGPFDSKGRTVWKCRCECGAEKMILATSLAQGLTKSCGCIRHGLSGTRLYTIWNDMKQRCSNAKTTRYPLYGGRGISVCNEWKNDFKSFYDWAMKNGYCDTLSIDRINNDGNYEPLNCRWATTSEQNRNRRPWHLKKPRQKRSHYERQCKDKVISKIY